MNTKPSPTFRSSDQFETSRPWPREEITDSPIKDKAISNEASAPAESQPAEPIGVTRQPKGRETDSNDPAQVAKQPTTSVKEPSIQPNSEPIEIDFRQLDDGRRLELIEDPADPTKTKLAVFDGGEVQLVSAFEYRGNIFVPIARECDGLGDIVLPHAPNPHLSAEEIFSRIVHLLESCLSIDPCYLNVLAAFVLYSWFADQLRPPVYLLNHQPAAVRQDHSPGSHALALSTVDIGGRNYARCHVRCLQPFHTYLADRRK